MGAGGQGFWSSRRLNAAERDKLLLELEHRLARIGKRITAAEAGALLADDFLEFGASGKVWTKSDIVAAMAIWQPISATIEEFKVREIAPAHCLVTYRFKTAERSTLRSSLWRNSSGVWQMIFHQGTIVQ